MKMGVHWSHHMTWPEATFSSTLSGVGLCVVICVSLWLPVFFPSPWGAPSASWQCDSCPSHGPCPHPESCSLLLCWMCWPAAFEYGPVWACQKPFCTYPGISTVISGKFPVHKGLFASLLYAPVRSSHSSVSLTTTPGWGHKIKGRIRSCPDNIQPQDSSRSRWVWAHWCFADTPSGTFPVSLGAFLWSERLWTSVLIMVPRVRCGESRCRSRKRKSCTVSWHPEGPLKGSTRFCYQAEGGGRNRSRFVVVSTRRRDGSRASRFRTRSNFSSLRGHGGVLSLLVWHPTPGHWGGCAVAQSVTAP